MDQVHTLLQDHLLHAYKLIPVARIRSAELWPALFLILCLVLLALIKLSSLSGTVKIVQSALSLQTLPQMERQEINPFRFYSLGLSLFFVLNLSFLLYKLNSIYKLILVSSPALSQFLFFFLLILLGFSLKLLANRVLGFFTNERKVISEYIVNSLYINQTFGLFLFPWIILMEWCPINPLIFISAGLIALGLSILLKWYRGMIMGLVEERLGLLQIFSYFCGLEILPVFVLVKYIIETF